MSFSTLEIGKRALIAQRLGLDLTSNNIANVNTPGYSRRTPVISETSPQFKWGNFLGSGVVVDKLRNFREEFFDREIRTTTSRQYGYEADEKVMQTVEAVFGEPSDSGINEMVSQFFNAFEELSLKPENSGLRTNILEIAQTLVDRFHSTAGQISDTRQQVSLDLKENINKVNALLGDIAKLNKSISQNFARAGSDSQTLVDQRELKLEELSKLIQVNVTQADDGTVNVFANGINLITGSDANQLKAQDNVNSSTGEITLQIYKYDKNNNAKSLLTIQSGELASQLKNYNITLDDKDSSGEFSIMNSLNDFVNALAQKINNLTIGGYGLDDTGTIPPGRLFFEPAIGSVTAENIEISSDIKNKPRDIPLSDAPNEPGNNAIALKIANLASDNNFLQNKTPSEYYTELLGNIGILSNEASNGRKTTSLISEQMQSQRESLIGVNIDEEAIDLIKYQKAFEAASRTINTTNSILETIVNLGR